VVSRPINLNQFEFAIVSGLRTAQLMRGCIARVPRAHKPITTAQREVAEGKVVGLWKAAPVVTRIVAADLRRIN
jgi:hypothetical protein